MWRVYIFFQRTKLLSTLDYDNAVKFDFLTVNIYFLLNSQWKCCFKINHLRRKVKNIWLNCNIERNPCSINCIYQAVDTWWRHQMEIFSASLLCGEFNGDRWIPITKASDAVLWCFLSSVAESTVFDVIVMSHFRHQSSTYTNVDLSCGIHLGVMSLEKLTIFGPWKSKKFTREH